MPADKPTSLTKRARGLVIGLLILSILNLPLSLYNCSLGFFNTEVYGFDNGNYTQGKEFDTVAGLGLAFGLITLLHGVFGIVKITIFAMDIDHKISSRVRSNFIKACLIIEAAIFILTLIFGLAYTLYTRNSSISIDYAVWGIVWIVMGVTLVLQLITILLLFLLRSSTHADSTLISNSEGGSI